MCLRIIFNMYINDALILRGILRALDTLGIYAYDSSASDFYTNIYSELSFKLYLTTQIYTHKNMFYHTSYYKYFSYDKA